MTVIVIAAVCVGIVVCCMLAHFISYRILKKRILKRQKWDLNICCGQTNGGGINADIVEQKGVPNFRLIKDVYKLPFQTGQFDTVLCSHTIEHVDSPELFLQELQRIGKKVTIVIPPLYDATAALNIFEHKHIFLSFKKEHQRLPKYAKLPLASFIQKRIGQINHEKSASKPLILELIFSLFSVNHRKKLKLKTNKPVDSR
ncbi:MAG: methyltransferase domain-containing protein [Candidatus Aminicenantes bacterium]|jgi:ubiquinone/menaquinone biosynthesis C-methylase UbiE